MPLYDLVVRNGAVVTASDEFKCDIGIKDGVVISLSQNIEIEDGVEVVDAEGGFITVSHIRHAIV